MSGAEVVALIALILAVISIAMVAALWAGLTATKGKVDEAKAKAEKCKNATKELMEIQAALEEAVRKKSRENCEKVNKRIDEWNAKYAADCADGKTVPRLDCNF